MMNTVFVTTWSGNYGVYKKFTSKVEALECANELNKELGDTVNHPYVVMTAAERVEKEAEQSAWERDFYLSLSNKECVRYGIG